MIKKILYQVGLAGTIGVGTILTIGPVTSFFSSFLETPLLQFIGGVGLIGVGIYIAGKYGKRFCATCET